MLPMARLRLLLAAAIIHVVAANHYKTLGVPRDATAEAIKASYKSIALKSHPDKVPKSASAETRQASQRRFEEANAAFEVLSDPAQRRQYDFELEHPMSRGEDGVFRHGAAPGEAAQVTSSADIIRTRMESAGWLNTGPAIIIVKTRTLPRSDQRTGMRPISTVTAPPATPRSA